MKRFAIIAAAGLVLGLAACNDSNKAGDGKAKTSAGAVSETKSGCCKDKANTSAGAVSEKKDCSTKSGCETKSDCGTKATSAGAVSEKKSSCASACPFTKG
jgi:hypothetical protein